MHQSPSGQWLLPSKQVIAGPNPAWCYVNVEHQQFTNLPGWIKWGRHPSFTPFSSTQSLWDSGWVACVA